MTFSQKNFRLDLRGVKCPLNWARSKVKLEQMQRGETLELILDDPRAVRDIPRAAEAEGYVVVSSFTRAGICHMTIEK